jgi:hypothetical protein
MDTQKIRKDEWEEVNGRSEATHFVGALGDKLLKEIPSLLWLGVGVVVIGALASELSPFKNK